MLRLHCGKGYLELFNSQQKDQDRQRMTFIIMCRVKQHGKIAAWCSLSFVLNMQALAMPAQVAKRLILVRKQLVNPLESVQLWLKRVPGL